MILPVNAFKYNLSKTSVGNQSNTRAQNKSQTLNMKPKDKVSFGTIYEHQLEGLMGDVCQIFQGVQTMKRLPKGEFSEAIEMVCDLAKACINKNEPVLKELDKVDFDTYFKQPLKLAKTEISTFVDKSTIIFNQFQKDKWLNTLNIDTQSNTATLMLTRKDDEPLFKVLMLKDEN